MPEITLKVVHADLDTIISALETAQTSLGTDVDSIRSSVTTKIAGWDPLSDSRQAQIDYDTRLGNDTETLATTLGTIVTKVKTFKDKAHTCEVRNVAVLD